MVLALDSAAGNDSFFDADSSENQLLFVSGSGDFSMFSNGNTLEGSSVTVSPIIVSALFDGSNSVLRVNGTAFSGSINSAALDGISLGARGDGSDAMDGRMGEVLAYPQDKSGIVADIESYLSNKWGIPI
jgi:hypothetical protein